MTASPEQTEAVFPDAEFHFDQLRLTEFKDEYRAQVEEQGTRRVLWDAWQAGFYVYEVLHTERAHPFAPKTHTEIRTTGLAKRRT